MTDGIKIEYRGAVISYSESVNLWRASVRGTEVGDPVASLTEARAAVDKHIKREAAFERIPIVEFVSHWGEFKAKRGTVTSVADVGGRFGDRTEAWITWEDGRRSRTAVGAVYVLVDAESRIPEIDEITKQIDDLVARRTRKIAEIRTLSEYLGKEAKP